MEKQIKITCLDCNTIMDYISSQRTDTGKEYSYKCSNCGRSNTVYVGVDELDMNYYKETLEELKSIDNFFKDLYVDAFEDMLLRNGMEEV